MRSLPRPVLKDPPSKPSAPPLKIPLLSTVASFCLFLAPHIGSLPPLQLQPTPSLPASPGAHFPIFRSSWFLPETQEKSIPSTHTSDVVQSPVVHLAQETSIVGRISWLHVSGPTPSIPLSSPLQVNQKPSRSQCLAAIRGGLLGTSPSSGNGMGMVPPPRPNASTESS